MASKMVIFGQQIPKQIDDNFPCTYRGVLRGCRPRRQHYHPRPCEHDLGDRGLTLVDRKKGTKPPSLLPHRASPIRATVRVLEINTKTQAFEKENGPFVPGRQNLQILPPNGPPLFPPPQTQAQEDQCKETCLNEHPSQVTIGPTI